LVLTLNQVRSDTPSDSTQPAMSWDALTQAGHKFGMPAIDYKSFNRRWNAIDPKTGQPTSDAQTLKNLVARFDGNEVVIDAGHKDQPQQGQPKTNDVERSAMAATKRQFK